MGRGDKKTKKGKRSIGSFGVSRSRVKVKSRLKRATSRKPAAATVVTEAKPKKAVSRKKAEA